MGFEIRADRGRNQGRAGLPGERAEYFRLMDLGYSNAAACRAVGVTVRTPTSSSFPSGHTLAAFCTAFVLAESPSETAGDWWSPNVLPTFC